MVELQSKTIRQSTGVVLFHVSFRCGCCRAGGDLVSFYFFKNLLKITPLFNYQKKCETIVRKSGEYKMK